MSIITLSLIIVFICTVLTALIIFWASKYDDETDLFKVIFIAFCTVCLIWSSGIISIILCLIKYFTER